MTAQSPSPQTARDATDAGQAFDVGPATSPLAVADANETGPRIVFEKVVHDFGEVAPQSVTTGEFGFGNAGYGVLQIPRIEGCCGFLVKLAESEYKRGETGLLEVKFHAGPQPGFLRQQIIVHTNDRTQPTAALTVSARIVEKVRYEPRRLVFLFQDEKTACSAITLTSVDEKPFSIVGFTSTADCLTVDYDSAKQATQYVLAPRVDLERVQGGMSGLIHVSLTHPACDKVTIPFKALGRFEINPAQIVVLDAEPNKPVVRKVRVQNNYGEEFDVESVSSRNNLIRIVGVQKVDNGHEFDVEITPPPVDGGAKEFTDVFVVTVQGGQELTAFCRGFYAEAKVTSGRLTDAQKAYLDWTETYFASFLHRSEYVTLSDPTKRELEQMWIRCLEQQRTQQYYEAINGLAAIQSARAIQALARIAFDPQQKDNRARWMAVRALGVLGDESVVPDLIHLVYHYHQNTRLWAQISLVRLTGVDFEYDWQRWGQWWNEEKGTPRFLAERIVWSADEDLANIDRQMEKDRQFFDQITP